MKNYIQPQTDTYSLPALMAIGEVSTDPIGGNILGGGAKFLEPGQAR